MKRLFLSIFSVLITVFAVILLPTFAQDYITWMLPEGAVARLGKSTIDEIEYSPDGTLLAVAGAMGIWLYDAQSGKELHLLLGNTENLNGISFSPDGKTIAGISRLSVRQWDVASGLHLGKLTSHSGYSMAYSPDGKLIAIGGYDGGANDVIYLLDAESAERLHVFGKHKGRITSVSFSPDGSMLISAGRDGYIHLWDVVSRSHLWTFKRQKILRSHNSGVTSVKFSPDGQIIASASENGIIRLWNPEPGDHLRVLRGHQGRVGSISFSPDGKTNRKRRYGSCYAFMGCRIWETHIYF